MVLTAVRKFLKGKTHRLGVRETRGRKLIYSAANVRTMNKVRKSLVKKVEGNKYVAWDQVRDKARAPAGHSGQGL